MISLQPKGGDAAAILHCFGARFSKIGKDYHRRFSMSSAGERAPLGVLGCRHVSRATWMRLFLRAIARESPPVTLREGALKKGSWLVHGFASTFVSNS